MQKYQDEEALTAVETKVAEGTKKEQEITEWKDTTTKEATDFEKFVVEEFQKLGVVLDLSELDMARAKAEENWAIQEEMRRMKAKLQGEGGQHVQANMLHMNLHFNWVDMYNNVAVDPKPADVGYQGQALHIPYRLQGGPGQAPNPRIFWKEKVEQFWWQSNSVGLTF